MCIITIAYQVVILALQFAVFLGGIIALLGELVAFIVEEFDSGTELVILLLERSVLIRESIHCTLLCVDRRLKGLDFVVILVRFVS